jgi:membrane protein DedA with SNARE-associated domain
MQQWLSAVPPAIVYLAVFLVVGGQFVCLPLPGGVALTTAGLLAVRGSVEPWLVCVAAVAGVLAGSAVGYRLGRRGGRAALDRLTRRFPRVLPPKRLATTERLFARWGSWLLVASCFSAVLRMAAAPSAGTLSIPVRRFTLAMAASAVLWSVGTATALYYLGLAAESWIDGLSWVGLAMLAVLALASIPSWFRSAPRSAEAERNPG